MIITFDELRKVKDSLPDGSMKKIASQLSIDEDTVRNYFGGAHYAEGESIDIHYEKGANGGVVKLLNTEIFEAAQKLLGEEEE